MVQKIKKPQITTIINLDRNGKLIKDLSKVVIPIESQMDLLKQLQRLDRK